MKRSSHCDWRGIVANLCHTFSVGRLLFSFPHLKADWSFTGWKLSAAEFCGVQETESPIAFLLYSWLVLKNAHVLDLLMIPFCSRARAVLLVGGRKGCGQILKLLLCIILDDIFVFEVCSDCKEQAQGEAVTSNCLFLLVNKCCSSTTCEIIHPPF